MKMPIAKLSNGLKVANFSSPHEFKFEDGTILKACSNEHAEQYKINFVENTHSQEIFGIPIKNITLSFELTDLLQLEIQNILNTWEDQDDYNIILIPLPMLTAIKESEDFKNLNLEDSPFRVIRMKSRTEKLVRIDHFCL